MFSNNGNKIWKAAYTTLEVVSVFAFFLFLCIMWINENYNKKNQNNYIQTLVDKDSSNLSRNITQTQKSYDSFITKLQEK